MGGILRPLLAVDGDSLAHRAFHALPSSIRDGEGNQANMIVGFANMLLRVWEAEEPRTVFVGFDTIGEPLYRHELLGALGFAWAKKARYEADDFLAAAVRVEEERGGETLVLTSDRDLFQLASPRTTVLVPRRGVSELDRVDPAGVRERYGVDPSQVADFIALRGDPSDKIPGAKGIGPGRAATILREYETLDGAIEAGVFQEQAESLRTYLRIARLQFEAPVPELPDAQPSWEDAADLTEGWGLKALSKRMRERTQA